MIELNRSRETLSGHFDLKISVFFNVDLFPPVIETVTHIDRRSCVFTLLGNLIRSISVPIASQIPDQLTSPTPSTSTTVMKHRFISVTLRPFSAHA
jgi:hypothetical protein